MILVRTSAVPGAVQVGNDFRRIAGGSFWILANY